jgi:hypothetical protein
MPTAICSPEPVPALRQSLGKHRVKIFLKIAFISNDSSELAGFPSLFDRITCCVVKETVDMPMRIAQPVNRSGIPMKELGIQLLARPAILVSPSLPDLALHLGFHRDHRFIHCRPCGILNHLIARDRQIDAGRLRRSEHQPIANLPVADRLPVYLSARIHTARKPFTRRRIFVSQ